MRRRDFIGAVLASPLAAWLGIKPKPKREPRLLVSNDYKFKDASDGCPCSCPDCQSEWVTPRQFKNVSVDVYDTSGRRTTEVLAIPADKRYIEVIVPDAGSHAKVWLHAAQTPPKPSQPAT